MKRRLAAFLTAAMIMSSLSMPVMAEETAAGGSAAESSMIAMQTAEDEDTAEAALGDTDPEAAPEDTSREGSSADTGDRTAGDESAVLTDDDRAGGAAVSEDGSAETGSAAAVSEAGTAETGSEPAGEDDIAETGTDRSGAGSGTDIDGDESELIEAASSTSGTWEGFNWRYDSDSYTLTITGSGAMPSPIDDDTEFRGWCGDENFYSCKKIVIGEGITSIGNNMFVGLTSLTAVSLPSTLTSIGDYAFLQCTALKSISLPVNLTTIGEGSFLQCSALTAVTLASASTSKLTSIGDYAFQECTALKSISLPSGFKTIGFSAFNGAGLTGIDLPASLETLSGYAFQNCTALSKVIIRTSLDDLTISDFGNCFSGCTKLTSLGSLDSGCSIEANMEETIPAWLFANASLTSIDLPDTVTTIGMAAFRNCPLQVLELGENVTSVGNYAFYCEDTTTPYVITVGNAEMTIGDYGLGYPAKIRGIYSSTAQEYSILYGVNFEGTDEGHNVYFYQGNVNLVYNTKTGIMIIYGRINGKESVGGSYSDSDGWTYPEWQEMTGYNHCLKEIQIIRGVAEITDVAFCFAYGLEKVTICSSVTEIGDYAFYNDFNLEEVIYANEDMEIADTAFEGCTAYQLSQIETLEGDWGDIHWSFDGESGQLTISGNGAIPDTPLDSDGYAIWPEDSWMSVTGLSRLITSVVIEDGVTRIGRAAFLTCLNLETVTMPDSVTEIGDYAFKDCTSLTKADAGPQVSRIGEYAYEDCRSLTSLTIANPYCQLGLTVDEPYAGAPLDIGLPTQTTIRGYTGSEAEEYAENYGNAFESIGYLVTVTFNGAGGTVTKKTVQLVTGSKYGSQGSLPTAAQANCTFAGWYTAQFGGTKVTASTTVSSTSDHTLYAHWTYNNTVEGFVTRLYNVCLNRKPDASGLTKWCNQLRSGTKTGVSAASGFIFSTEFKNKNLCNEDYVKYLYQAFMGRNADSAGLASWVKQLESGKTREEVFNGFAMSSEFKKICAGYGITQGSKIAIPTYGTQPTGACSVCGTEDGVTQFVKRLYSICLGRNADSTGLANWCAKLRNHTGTGASVAKGFFFSSEFTKKNYSNAEYVKRLYQVFLNRSADSAGLNSWVKKLQSGTSRLEVMNGFAGSQEFINICKKYGISAK